MIVSLSEVCCEAFPLSRSSCWSRRTILDRTPFPPSESYIRAPMYNDVSSYNTRTSVRSVAGAPSTGSV